MSIRNKMQSSPTFEGDPFDVAERLMDLLFLDFKDYEPLNFQSIITKSNLTDDDKVLAQHLSEKINTLMHSKFFYAEKADKGKYHGCSTTLGRKVKASGGHYMYLEKLKKEKELTLERQLLRACLKFIQTI